MRKSNPSFYLGTQVDGVHLNAEQLHVRDENLNNLLGNTSYTEALFHILRGRLPDENERKLFDLVLVAFHGGFGLLPPTTLVPRIAAGTGVSTAQALAAGYLASGPYHVGAVEHSMQLYRRIVAAFRDATTDEEATAGALEQFAYDYIAEMITRGETVPGYGHPLLRKDPRPTRIRRILVDMESTSPYLDVFDGVVRCLREKKGVVANVDGITAAILLTLGFQPQHGTGLFLLGRTAAMLAHVVEEQTVMPYQTMKRFMILPVVAPRLFNSDSRRLAALFNKLRDSTVYRKLRSVFAGQALRDASRRERADRKVIAAAKESRDQSSIQAHLSELPDTDAPRLTPFGEDKPAPELPVENSRVSCDFEDFCSPELLAGAACFLSASLQRVQSTASDDTGGSSSETRSLLQSALKLVEQASQIPITPDSRMQPGAN